MASLLDIAPIDLVVPVRGTPVSVTGVSAAGIASLLQRFPELREMMVGREVALDRLMQMGAEAIAAIIAAGTGLPGNAKAEALAASLLVEEQADLLAAILKVTLPRGAGPLVEKLSELAQSLGGGAV